MAGSSAPVMYWAVLNTLCCALLLRGGAFSIPSSDAASQDALDGAAVKPFEDLWAHVKSFQPPVGEKALSCPLPDCAGMLSPW
jgi:hypothetical protein